MNTTMVQQMWLVGIVDESINTFNVFSTLVAYASLLRKFDLFLISEDVPRDVDVLSEEQAKKCVDIVMSMADKMYEDASGLINEIESRNRRQYHYGFWLNSYIYDITQLPPEILRKYGLRGITADIDAVKAYWKLLNALTYGTTFNRDGLKKLHDIKVSYVKNVKEYEKYCGKPSLRDLLTLLFQVCKNDKNALKHKLLQYIPPPEVKSYDGYIITLFGTVCSHIEAMGVYFSQNASDFVRSELPAKEFEERWDYLVRSVPSFEEYIKELRDFLDKSRGRKTVQLSDTTVSQFFDKHGFTKTYKRNSISDDLVNAIQKLLETTGKWSGGGLCKLLEGISCCYRERSDKSLALPSCFKERLTWFACLVKDSRQQLAYYNIRKSCLLDSLSEKLKAEELHVYVTQVTNALIILPMVIWNIVLEFTSKNFDYGYYEGAIFSSEYSEDYLELFYKILIDLLRDVHHIARLTAPRNLWNNLTLQLPKYLQDKSQDTSTATHKKTIQSYDKNGQKVDERFELEFDTDNTDYALQAHGGSWRSVKDEQSPAYGDKNEAARSQMLEWFLYEGFSVKALNTSMTGFQIHDIMNALLQGNLGLQKLYGYVWKLIDKTLEQFLTAPKNFKERLDWLAKLDSGDSDDYNALDQMIDRLSSMGVEGDLTSAKAMNSLVDYAASLRRLLVEDTEDFGEYNGTFCYFTAVDSYFMVLCEFIDNLENDFKDVKKHIKGIHCTKDENIKDCTKFCNWIKERGFDKSSLASNTKGEALVKFLEKSDVENLNILKKFLGWIISTMEPGNVKDMMEWCYGLTTKKRYLNLKLKQNVIATVSQFVGNRHASEIGEVCDKFINAVPEMRELLQNFSRSASPFVNAIFDYRFEKKYFSIFNKILSAMYQHRYVTAFNPFDIRKADEGEALVERMAEYEVLQEPIGRLLLATDVIVSKETNVSEINEKLDNMLTSVFGITNGNENRKNALEGYVAMMQGIKVIRQPDESNLALTAAVTTAVGTGAVGAGVVYFKFNALYAFFGKLLA
ncbi:YqeG family HAD IIIA-type phosphatase [Babesia caballi]|uniref:YqeG family HAD IIIA-type phosphatase n=1 Tax=Babesia caballi TaxID=5871 RepID=A0AAV4LTR4_BABCB|nr:YqeG family HAD IIIA-type phosphatase [Babesia caballi]